MDAHNSKLEHTQQVRQLRLEGGEKKNDYGHQKKLKSYGPGMQIYIKYTFKMLKETKPSNFISEPARNFIVPVKYIDRLVS